MLDELRRRNVHRVALGYLAGAWLLVQVVDTLTPTFLPEAVFRVTVIVLAVGFVPALILAWKFEWTPEGLRQEPDVPAQTPRPASRVFDRLITTTLIAAVAYFAVDKFVIDPERDKAAIEAATEQALSGAFIDEFRDRSIVVLPFVNLSSDPEQAYFADGISEELLNLLARIDELRVISRSTSWTFKGKEIDVGEVQRRLDVSHILEGSVRKAGNLIRVTAQLIDARTDTHLWSETYDREFEDIFAIQDEISAAVVNQLKLEMLNGPPAPEEIDPRAYELYLKGRYISHTLDGGPRVMEALDYLERATEIEPAYLPAVWELANVHKNLYNGPDVGQDRSYHEQQIYAIAERLVAIAPESSYTHYWLALAADDDELDKIALHLEQAIAAATDENRTDMLRLAAVYLNAVGRHAEAELVAAYVVSRDPACGNCVQTLANALRSQDRHRDAAEIIEAQLEWRALRRSDIWPLGVSWLVAGEPEKALAYFDQMDIPAVRALGRVLSLWSLGDQEAFEKEFADFRASYADEPEGIARVYAWTGDADNAWTWLRKEAERRGGRLPVEYVTTDLYEPIGSDPRIREMIDEGRSEYAVLGKVPFNPEYPPSLQAKVDALPGGQTPGQDKRTL